MTRQQLLDLLDRSCAEQEKCLILNHNLHSLYLYLTMPAFRDVYANASFVYIDGVPVLWLGRLAGLSLAPDQRITFLDCFDDILSHAQALGRRVFYLGSSAEILEQGLELLRVRYPALAIAGHHGYLSLHGEDSAAVVRDINEFQPDILFVGMGMPLQEFWLGQHLPSLRVPNALTCGATLEYVTGHSYKPPAWAGPLGLYGLMRLLHDPKRLWRRYLAEPLVLTQKLLLPLLRQRRNL